MVAARLLVLYLVASCCTVKCARKRCPPEQHPVLDNNVELCHTYKGLGESCSGNASLLGGMLEGRPEYELMRLLDVLLIPQGLCQRDLSCKDRLCVLSDSI